MVNERFILCGAGVSPLNFLEAAMSGSVLTASSALVLGGARSGKTAYALRLAEAAAPERLYLATAEAR